MISSPPFSCLNPSDRLSRQTNFCLNTLFGIGIHLSLLFMNRYLNDEILMQYSCQFKNKTEMTRLLLSVFSVLSVFDFF